MLVVRTFQSYGAGRRLRTKPFLWQHAVPTITDLSKKRNFMSGRVLAVRRFRRKVSLSLATAARLAVEAGQRKGFVSAIPKLRLQPLPPPLPILGPKFL